jgi:hypothetical protein
LARNIFEKTLENQANRLAQFKDISQEMMMSIEKEDIS